MKAIVYKIELLLIVIIFVFLGVEVKAQYPYNFSYAGIPYNSRTIVRSYDEENVVVYYEEGGRGYVSLVNVFGNNIRTVPLAVGVSMNDMCIMNDTVFLCGNESSFSNGTYGCVVSMDLNNFYTSSVPVSYFEPSYWLYMNLKRIKYYTYTSGSHIYKEFLFVGEITYPCDGSFPFPSNMMYAGYLNHKYYYESGDNSSCTENVVVECRYPFPAASPSDRIICFMNTEDHAEVIHDVVVTDNYVAFVGITSGVYDSITLHICDKYFRILSLPNPLPPSITNIFDNYDAYSLGTTNGAPFYHACALGGDRIAIATHAETSTTSDKITVRTFELSSRTMINSQVLQCSPSPILKDMTYSPDLHEVVLLFYDYFQATGDYRDVFCTADPDIINPSYIRSGMAQFFHNLKYGSLDAMRGTYFISTGGKHGIVSNAANYNPTASCYKLWDYRLTKVYCINLNNGSYDYDRYNPTSTRWSTVEVPIVSEIPSVCIEN